MKLIYIYFDFTDNGEHPEGYRGFKKCGFNFEPRKTSKCKNLLRNTPTTSQGY